MKKITLAFFAIISSATAGFGQVTTTLQAPQSDGSWSTLHAPSGSANAVYHKACYLVKQTELTGLALTNSVITGVGFEFLNGVSSPVTGQFTIHLQNTGDVTYTKGTNFATAIAPMSLHYNGNYSIPVSQGTASIVLPLTTGFTYTGGGIYVAFEWFCAAPNSTLPARYLCNTTGLTPIGGGYTFTAVGPAPTTMSLDIFRPAFLFTAANTATNELSVTRMQAMGKYSKLLTGGQVVTAQVKNSSNIAKTNVAVTLTVAGSNPFTDTQTIPSLAAGSSTTISFAPYATPANGLSNMSVTIPNDQVNTNNLWVWQQTVTCNDFAQIPPFPASSFSASAYGWNTNGGIYSWRMTPPSAASLNSIYFALAATGTFTDNMYAVLMDVSGNISAYSKTVTLNATMAGNFVNFDFDPPVALTPGTPYLFGVAQPAAPVQYFPFANIQATYTVSNFYLSPIGGGSATNANRGYIAIGAVLGFSNTSISAVANKTAVCNNVSTPYPQSVTLTATSPSSMSYNWSAPGNPTTAVIVVTPSTVTSPAGGAGAAGYTVSGTDPVTGCKSNSVAITIKLNKCTGITNNGDFGSNINVYPNPVVNGISTIEGLEGENTISVYTMLGQNISVQVSKEETTTVDFSNLPSGNYFIKITNKNNDSKLIKVLNQK